MFFNSLFRLLYVCFNIYSLPTDSAIDPRNHMEVPFAQYGWLRSPVRTILQWCHCKCFLLDGEANSWQLDRRQSNGLLGRRNILEVLIWQSLHDLSHGAKAFGDHRYPYCSLRIAYQLSLDNKICKATGRYFIWNRNYWRYISRPVQICLWILN